MKFFLKFNCFFILLIWYGCQQEISDQIRNTQLIISNFTPDSAKGGDLIQINGKGFDPTTNGNIVTINNNRQLVIRATDTTIVIRIDTTSTSGKIKIQTNGQEASSSKVLIISSATQNQQLKIISFAPDAARIGDTIKIKGTGFSSVLSDNIVSINNISSQLISANDSVLIIKILTGTVTGKLSVTVKSVTVISTGDLIIISMSGNFWTQKADPLPIGNIFVKGFSSATKGYFLNNGKLLEYDPSNNSWAFKTGVPATIKNYGFSFTIGSKAYIGLGASAPGNIISMTKEVWEYDMTNNTWAKKNDFPGSKRVAPFSFSINNFGYVGGGDTTNANISLVKDVWKYNPQSDSWTKQSNFPGTRANGVTGFTIDNKGFVLEVGQNNPTAYFVSLASVNLWTYDPTSDTWTQKVTLNTNKSINSASVFTINGKAYAAIGSGNPGELQPVKNDFWEYNPSINSWSKKADVGGPIRWFSSGFSIGSKGYIGLGTGNGANILHKDFWEYTPEQ